MSTQEFMRNKSPIGKFLFAGAIGTWGVHTMLQGKELLLVLFVKEFNYRYIGTDINIALTISYLFLACGAACFYLMRAQPQLAARVWGILGGLTFMLSPFVLFPPMSVTSFLIVGGAMLAAKKPKLAGILMLVGALLSWLWGNWQMAFFALMGDSFFGSSFRLPAVSILPSFTATSFLIPGGILALSPQRQEPVSTKMALGLIGAFFIASLLSPPLLWYFIYVI